MCAVKFSYLTTLPLASGAQALILQIPVGWQSGSPANASWASAVNDIPFDLQVVNTDEFHDTFGLANDVNPILNFIFFTLPVIPQGTYTLRALNTTDTAHILDETPGFDIQAPPASSLSSTSPPAGSGSYTHSQTSSNPNPTSPVNSPSGSPASTPSSSPNQTGPTTTTDRTSSMDIAHAGSSDVFVSSLPTSPSAPATSKPRLSRGAIAGVAVGSVGAIVVVLVLVAFVCVKRRRRRHKETAPQVDPFEDDHLASRILRSHVTMAIPIFSDHSDDRSKLWIGDEVKTQGNISMIGRTSSMGSSALDRVTHVPQPNQERTSGGVMAQKVLRKLTPLGLRNRGRTAATSGGGDGNAETHATATEIEPTSSSDESERLRDTQRETDGGVRLAGGRPGEAVTDSADCDTASEGSTLPPPYSEHFHEA